MNPRTRWPRWPAAALGAAFLGAWLAASRAQDQGSAHPAHGNSETPCAFRSASLMPVAEMRGLGYTNNTRVLVDAKGTVWIALRSKNGGQYTIGLVRAESPWREGMKTSVTWIEDRDSLPFSGAPQRVPAIAAAPDGAIHMAWYGGMAGAPDHQIHYARFTPGSTTRIAEERAPFRVPGFESVAVGTAKPSDLWQEHASIAVGPDGIAHLAWEARDPSRRSSDGMPRPGIAYATRTPDGVWSVNGALDRVPYLDVGGGAGQSRPSILVDRAGLVHVICYGGIDGTQQIQYGSVAARGFSGWKPIAPSSGDQRHAAAALDAQGRLHVAWREGLSTKGSSASTAIFYSVREPDGRWHKPTRLTTADENASTPSVGVTDSSVCVAWVAWTPGAINSDGQVDNGFPSDNSTVEGRVEVSASPLGREQFEPPIVIDPGPGSYPCWAVGPSNGAARPPLAWTHLDSGRHMSLQLGWCERRR